VSPEQFVPGVLPAAGSHHDQAGTVVYDVAVHAGGQVSRANEGIEERGVLQVTGYALERYPGYPRELFPGPRAKGAGQRIFEFGLIIQRSGYDV
jgi:hypothetical protein